VGTAVAVFSPLKTKQRELAKKQATETCQNSSKFKNKSNKIMGNTKPRSATKIPTQRYIERGRE